MANQENDIVVLFIHFLEGRLEVEPELLNRDEILKTYPEVGEGKPPSSAIYYHGGLVDVIKGDSASLYNRGFQPYPTSFLTTSHALVLTRALAAYHATSVTKKPQAEGSLESVADDGNILEGEEKDGVSINETTKSFNDQWTAEVSQLGMVESHLEILCDRLRCGGHNPRTVQKLQALHSDLPTLTQFLQFASAMQTNKLSSVGPIGISDVWFHKDIENDEEDTVIIRLRGGTHLQATPLRDPAWLWLTLLTPETLRERYMELCGIYCDHFNSTLRRTEATSSFEELSFFDVMQDLGENFLHAFLTIVHKFVLSGTWYMDRELHTTEGLQNLADAISFLVDNGIVGSIFIV